MIAEIIKDFDILPNAQFEITGFNIFRCNLKRFGGG